MPKRQILLTCGIDRAIVRTSRRQIWRADCCAQTTNVDILAIVLRRRIDGAVKRSLVGRAKKWGMGMDTVKLRGILADLIRARIALSLHSAPCPGEITLYKRLSGLNHFFCCCVQGAWSRASATVSSIFFCSSL